MPDPPDPVACSKSDCGFNTPRGLPDWTMITEHLRLHNEANHQSQSSGVPAATTRGPSGAKLDKRLRPSATLGMTELQWRFYLSEWGRYRRQTNIEGQSLLDELWSTMDTELRQLAFSEGGEDTLATEELMLARIKSLSVTVLHSSVHIVALHEMKQLPGESVKAFSARVRGTAANCNLTKKCPTDNVDVSYQEETCYHVVISGLQDHDMKDRVLTQAMLGTITDLTTLVNYCTAEESGRMTAPSTIGQLRQSTFKKEKGQKLRDEYTAKVKCSYCGGLRHGDGSQAAREKSCRAYGKTCHNCQKKDHLANVCKSAKKSIAPIEEYSVEEATNGAFGFYGISSSDPPTIGGLPGLVGQLRSSSSSTISTVPLPHMVHDVHLGWLEQRPRNSPRVAVSLQVHYPSYSDLSLALPHSANPRARRAQGVQSIPDTGAMMNVVPASLIKSLGIDLSSLFPIKSRVSGPSSEPISLVGGIILEVAGGQHKSSVSTIQLFYVSSAVKSTYLSMEACVQLGIVPPTFPAVGAFSDSTRSVVAAAEVASVGPATPHLPKCTNTGLLLPGEELCSCPERTPPPTDGPELPCDPTVENLPRLKQYILDRYKSSAFNTCERQKLPLITGSPPLRLFIDPAAPPIAVHTPAQVPIHWQDAVRGGLERDIRLGVLERVPLNEPASWVSRMVITPKPNGEPRRVVDYQPLNRHAPRQTHHTEPPWALVSTVPSGVKKTVLDCFHGYHSVPIAEEDREYTTFITPWGRFRYCTTPQGFRAAGDGYSARMDKIVSDVERLRKCMDDSLLYDDDIRSNFFRTCDYLTLCSSHGAVFNPDKFQFGEDEVDFLGFTITDKGVKPTNEFIREIMSFPSPQNITDVRSWFGAVAQISFAFATAPSMLPFRHLLSNKVPFSWSADLEAAFIQSKHEIVRQCEAGVRSFDPSRPTALATDWSRVGMGFWLCQKHCDCGTVKPGCCATGWQTVYCGSRFCQPCESRYAPIEGESLSAAWAMEKCKFFLLGMPDFLLCIDHKPLLAILGQQDLSCIPNPRILGHKLRTMMFRFTPTFVPGKLHVIPDCFSRRSDGPSLPVAESNILPGDVSNVQSGYQESLAPPSWVTPTIQGVTGHLAAISTSPTQNDIHQLSLMEEFVSGVAMSSLAALDGSGVICPIAQNSSPPVSVVTWTRLESAALQSPLYQSLLSLVISGVPDDSNSWPSSLGDYYVHRHALIAVGPVILYHDRPIIPVSLRQEIIEHLHAGHQGVTQMYSRASSSVFWPHMRQDLILHRAMCRECTINAPSNPSMPPSEPEQPPYPFASVCADFFSVEGLNYLSIVDRYSGWLSIFRLARDDSGHVISVLREYIARWGVPLQFSSDGASVFTSLEMKSFFNRWGISHRVSSAYFPQSNKRAEVGVKSSKRLITKNLRSDGSLDTDKFARALLAHRNCPDPLTSLSPAQVVLGRVLRDHIPQQPGRYQPRAEWRLEADARETAFARRFARMADRLSSGSKQLAPLKENDVVAVQDQSDPHKPGKWTRTGVVVEVLGHGAYNVKMDGSNRVSRRNRKFLKRIVPFTPALRDNQVVSPPVSYLPPSSSKNSKQDIPSVVLPVTNSPQSVIKRSPSGTNSPPSVRKRSPPRENMTPPITTSVSGVGHRNSPPCAELSVVPAPVCDQPPRSSVLPVPGNSQPPRRQVPSDSFPVVDLTLSQSSSPISSVRGPVRGSSSTTVRGPSSTTVQGPVRGSPSTTVREPCSSSPVQSPQPGLPQSLLSSPPVPGVQHDYAAMARAQEAARQAVKMRGRQQPNSGAL